jgi:uncharacterized protein
MLARLALLLVVASLVAGCGRDEMFSAPRGASGTAGAAGAAGMGGTGGGGQGGQAGQSGNATFKVRESVEQLEITHAAPNTELELYNGAGTFVRKATTDDLGSLIFRQLAPGGGYTVRTTSAPVQKTGPLKVWSVQNSLPTSSFYSSQNLQPGYGYIETRDGTTLAAYITLPGPVDKGPYPTVVDYSGYNPAQPGAPVPGYANSPLCQSIPTLCNAPSDPSAEIASFLGFATVSVNMRGTGCSGGAYDYFDELQLLDGYDVIQAVAAQSWVLGHKVGMVGLSYPGIAELFVAQTRPPGLEAISPLSVIGNSYSTLYPGGILNQGFAVEWIQSVVDQADPYGQGWEQGQVDAGDMTCKENQLLHEQKVNNVQEAFDNPYYSKALGDPINPTFFAHEIEVPVFLSCAWQDEQTGPFFTTLLNQFTSSPLVRFNVYNGVHVDGFAPQILTEWNNFLSFYVARKIPAIPPAVRLAAPQLFQQIFKEPMTLPPDRFASYTDFNQAFDAYKAEDPLRVIFENGGVPGEAGWPQGTFEKRFSQWPPTETVPERWYFHGDGSLQTDPPMETDSASSFELDPNAGDDGILAPGGDVWDPLPDYDWHELEPGHAAAFISAPLAQDLVMVGTGSVDLWIKSNEDDADLQVTLTEVRPDGKEMYVQSGWLRASQRALSADATTLWPDQTHLAADASPLPAGQWTQARVAIAGFAHVFRAGSRIRVSVDTPGNSRAVWTFKLLTFPNQAVDTIAHEALYPSSVVLPVIPDVAVTTPLPPCPSLRGQPCRDYVPFTNTPAN